VKDMERVNREAVSRLEKLAAAHPKLAQYRLAMGEIYGGPPVGQGRRRVHESHRPQFKELNSWNQRPMLI